MNLIVKRYNPVQEFREFRCHDSFDVRVAVMNSGFDEHKDGAFCRFAELRDEIDRLEDVIKKLKACIK